MKKKNKPAYPAGRKLALEKKTITNLDNSELINRVGGATRHSCGGATCFTCNPKRCASF